MKKNITLIISLLFFFSTKSQTTITEDGPNGNEQIEAAYPQNSVNWLEEKYSTFFSNSCNSNLKNGPLRTITIYNQVSSSWSGDLIGKNCTKTISLIGCALTCQAMVMKTCGYNFDPGTWNTYLKNNGGYTGCLLIFNKNLMYTYTDNYFNFNRISKEECVWYSGQADDLKMASILRAFIDNLGYAIVKINRIYSSGKYSDAPLGHFVLIYDYIGSNPSLKDFILSDPGTVREDNTIQMLGNYYDTEKNGQSPLFLTNKKNGDAPTFHLYNKYNPSEIGFPHEIVLPKSNLSFGEPFKLSLRTFLKSASGAQTYCNLSWTLTYPDGNVLTGTSEEIDIDALYATGQYTLEMAVSDATGFFSDVKTFTVSEPNYPTPPVNIGDFGFTYSPANPTTCDQIEFTAFNMPTFFGKWEFENLDYFVTGSKYTFQFFTPGYKTVKLKLDGYEPVSLTFPVAGKECVSYQDDISKCTDCFVNSQFNYIGNNWYATAMNTEFKIKDISNYNKKYCLRAAVCWEGDCYHNTNLYEFWKEVCPYAGFQNWRKDQEECIESYPFIGCTHSVDVPDDQILRKPDHILSHVYTTEGTKTFKYWSNIYEYSKENEEIYGGANVIDCSKIRTSNQLADAVNHDWGWGHAYFSGSFVLSSLSKIPNYNKQKLILSACKSIELQPGITLDPSGDGNYIQLEVGVIEGSQSNTIKSYKVEESKTEITDVENIPDNKPELSIFPNPNNGTFYLISKNDEIKEIALFNTFGQVVYKKRINGYSNGQINITLPDISKGLYFAKVKGKVNNYTQKIIIE